MAYNRRTKMLAAAKRQMEEDGVEFSNADLKWRADDVYAQGVRSPCKTQRCGATSTGLFKMKPSENIMSTGWTTTAKTGRL